MPKLFVSDMDHTLLNDNSELPKDFKETLDLLNSSDSGLVLASGRTLFSIKNKVKDFNHEINFISDNGAIVEYNGKIIYKSVFSKEDIEEVLVPIRKAKETSIIASSLTSAYVEVYDDDHKQKLYEYYLDYNIVDDISKVNDDIIKVTMLSLENTVDNYKNFIEPSLSSRYNAVTAGKIWIDVMHNNVDKGEGLKHLLEEMNIDQDDVVAFGDYHNDIGMLELAGIGYAVENAHDDVKQIADFVIEDNNSAPVTRIIKEYLEKQ